MTPRELVSCECGARVSAEKAKIADNGSYHCEKCQAEDVKKFKATLERQRRRYFALKRLMFLRGVMSIAVLLNVTALAINLALDITLHVPINYWLIVSGFVFVIIHLAIQEAITNLLK